MEGGGIVNKTDSYFCFSVDVVVTTNNTTTILM